MIFDSKLYFFVYGWNVLHARSKAWILFYSMSVSSFGQPG